MQQMPSIVIQQKKGMVRHRICFENRFGGAVAAASTKRAYDETVVGLDWIHHPKFSMPSRWNGLRGLALASERSGPPRSWSTLAKEGAGRAAGADVTSGGWEAARVT